MFILFIIAAITAAGVSTPAVRVLDPSGAPIAGAVLSSGGIVSMSGPDGSFPPPTKPGDEGEVSAMGYERWAGIVPLDGVIVLSPEAIPSGVLIPVTAKRPTAASQGLAVSEIEAAGIPSPGIPGAHKIEILSPGVVVREYGGAVSVLSMSIRGSDPSQIGWNIDGHRIRSSMDGTPAVCLFQGLFSSMRLARGGGSAFSDGGLAGTIELAAAGPDDPAQAFAGGDSKGGAWAGASTPLGGLARLSCTFSSPTGPSGGRGRSGGALFSFSKGAFSSGTLVTSSSGDVEGPDWSPSEASISRSSIDSWIALGMGGGFSTEGSIHAGSMGYTSVSPSPIRDRHSEGAADASVTFSPSGLPLSVGATADVRTEWVGGTALGSHARTLSSIGVLASDEAGPLLLSAAARVEAATEEGPGSGLRLSALLRAGECLMVEAALSESFRRPTFNELYWPSDPFAEGNPDLKPESSTEADVSARFSRGPLSAGISLFRAVSDDLIIWAPSAGGIWRPGNISEVLRFGAELDGTLQASFLRARGSMSLQRIVDASDESTNEGKMLPYRPGITAGILVEAPILGVVPGISFSMTGDRWMNAANTIALPAYSLLGASLSAPVPGIAGLSIELAGTNILDTRYEETNGYQGRRRTFSAELRWEALP